MTPNRHEIASQVLGLVSPALYSDVLKDEAFKSEIGLLTQRTLTITDAIAFNQGVFFNSVRDAFNSKGARETIISTQGDSFEIWVNDEDQVLLQTQNEILILPDSRLLSPEPKVRKAGLFKLGKRALSKASYLKWEKRLHNGYKNNSDITDLHFDIMHSPSTVLESLIASHQSGNGKWTNIVPSNPNFHTRLVGPIEQASSLAILEENELSEYWENLPEVSLLEKCKLALTICGHGQITKVSKVSKMDADILLALIEWAISSNTPLVQIAMLEVGIPLVNEHIQLLGKLTNLLSTFLKNDLDLESGPYSILSNLMIGIDGYVSQAKPWPKTTLFYRRLTISTYASYLQSNLQSADFYLAGFAESISNHKSHYSLLMSILDMRTTPRLTAEQLSPNSLFSDHLGRLQNVAGKLLDSLPDSELKSLLIDQRDDGLQRILRRPGSFIPGYLEGSDHPLTALPDELDSAIEDQLNLSPTSARSFIALLNVKEVFEIPDKYLDKVVSNLESVKYFMGGFEKDYEIWTLFSGLAVLGSEQSRKDIILALEPLLRRQSTNIANNLHKVQASRIALMSLAAFEDRKEGYSWYAKFVEFLAFSEMSKEDAIALHGELQIISQLEPELSGFLGKSLAALRGLTR